jgi:hypothetical protein
MSSQGWRLGFKKSAQKSYITENIFFFNLKERRHQRSIEPVSTSVELKLLVEFNNYSNDGLRTFNLKNYEPQATSCEVQYKIQVTRYEL